MWDVDLREVATHIREANPFWFGLSVIVVTATFPLRALRWKVLLRTAWPEARLKPLWHATAIGFMANNVLPARAGELVRSYAGNRLVGMPFSTALASIAVERIFDGVVLVGLLLIAVMSPGFPAGAKLGSTSITTLATSMSALFVGALLFLIVLVQNRERAAPPIERLLQRVLPSRFGEKGVAIFRNLVTGLAVLRSGREVLVVLAWSLVVWLTNALSYILAFRAFDTDVPAVTSLVLQGVVAIGVAVPRHPGSSACSRDCRGWCSGSTACPPTKPSASRSACTWAGSCRSPSSAS